MPRKRPAQADRCEHGSTAHDPSSLTLQMQRTRAATRGGQDRSVRGEYSATAGIAVAGQRTSG